MAAKLPREMIRSKSEARNPKFEANPKFPNPKGFSFICFRPLDFEFVSDFEIRNSDLSTLHTGLAMAMPG
jgi:hypothetical protein